MFKSFNVAVFPPKGNEPFYIETNFLAGSYIEARELLLKRFNCRPADLHLKENEN
jgi:hypothetical protein